jgi:hypothetical protein
MKTTEPKTNQIKNSKIYLLTFLLSALFTLNITAKINKDCDTINNSSNIEQRELEKFLFANVEASNSEQIDISDIEVIEIEEEVTLGFDTSNNLPENFNPLKGKHDLDWDAIELTEMEEEVELGFDTSKYLPKDFNALKGKHDLDWSAIELIEMEEDIEIDFDTKAYLPYDFNPYKGMVRNTDVVVN